jgi:hypothetical protein
VIAIVPGRGTRRASSTSLIVTLGISAIDVLCCALVGGLVLFLILSQEGSIKRLASSRGPNRDLIILLSYETVAPEQVLRLRLLPPLGRAPAYKSAPTEYWSDRMDGGRIEDSVLQDGGVSSWSILGDDRRPGSRQVVLHVHRPAPGQWGFSVGYVDAAENMAGVPNSTVPMTIRVFGGAAATCTLTAPGGLALNEVLEVKSDGQPRLLSNGGQQSFCTPNLTSALTVTR